MSSPVGYPQRNAYPMFSSTSQGDVPVGKNGANLVPVMATTSAQVVASKGAGIALSAGSSPLTVPGYDALDPVAPTIPTLTLSVKGALSVANPAVIWMDPDGTCYGAYTTLLYRSIDGGATWGSNGAIANFSAGGNGKILAFRRLANGEAIVSTDTSGAVGSKLWLSSGFAADPATATWTAVLTRADTETAFIDRSISVDGNSIACSAYGYPGYGVSRYVYYSTDAGLTWTTPFDTYLQCPNSAHSHIHGCALDHIGGLMWVYTGDGGDNRGVHVAKLGDFSTWQKIWADQPTTAYPMRNCMVLGTDNPDPNGIVRIRRNSWQLESAAQVPSNNVLVGSTVYCRGRPGDALYLASVFLGGQGDHGFVHATADGENVYTLYEAPVGTSIRRCLGPTDTGLLHLVLTRDGTSTEETATAIAPKWVPQSSVRNQLPLQSAYDRDCTLSLPGIWYAGRGSPASAKAGVNESAYEAMLFDPAASETAICPILVPPGADFVDIDLWWTNAGAGIGNVTWTLYQGRAFVDGATLNASDFNNPNAVTVAAPMQHVLKKTRVRTQLPTLGASVLRLSLNRNGTDAADTLDANDAAAVAIVATRTL